MATLDVITLDEAKAAISNNAGVNNDDLLTAYITAVSQAIDQACGPVVIRTVTAEMHDGGADRIFLNSYPIVALSAITEYAGTSSVVLTEQTAGTIPDAGYLVRKDAGYIERLSSGQPWQFSTGVGNVSVTYTAGRFANTAAVSAKFKQAAAITLANIWRREFGMSNAPEYGLVAGVTYLLPNAAVALLDGEMQLNYGVA